VCVCVHPVVMVRRIPEPPRSRSVTATDCERHAPTRHPSIAPLVVPDLVARGVLDCAVSSGPFRAFLSDEFLKSVNRIS